MHRFLTRHRWIWLPVALALVVAGVLKGAVHVAAPGSPWAEVCSAGGSPSAPFPAGSGQDSARAAPCLLCLLAVQGWTMTGTLPTRLATPAPMRVVAFAMRPSRGAPAAIHAPPRGPPPAG